MAIEAKFIISDPGIFWSLQTIDQLGDYKFSEIQITEIDDAYLDTKKRRLLSAGYSCRRRDQDKGVLITLLKLDSVKESTQKPKKWKMSLKRNSNNPADWPKCQVRSRVLKIVTDKKLRTINNLHQSRITRLIKKDKQIIAQANLDNVSLITKDKEQHFKTLKLKMIGTKQEKNLKALIATIQAKWPLELDPRTKFEHIIAIERKLSKG